MTLGLMFQPVDPFPDPIHAGQEIEFVGVLFASILVLIVLMYLMIYTHQKLKKYLPAVVILGFSFLIGMEFIIHNYIPITPLIVIFFMMFQTTIFLMLIFEINKNESEE